VQGDGGRRRGRVDAVTTHGKAKLAGVQVVIAGGAGMYIGARRPDAESVIRGFHCRLRATSQRPRAGRERVHSEHPDDHEHG
jgi:hypothetical protein